MTNVYIVDSIIESYAKTNSKCWADISTFAASSYSTETGMPVGSLGEQWIVDVDEDKAKNFTEKFISWNDVKKERISELADIYLGSCLLDSLSHPFPAASFLFSIQPLIQSAEAGRSLQQINMAIKLEHIDNPQLASLLQIVDVEKLTRNLKSLIPEVTAATLLNFLETREPMHPKIRQKYLALFAVQLGEAIPFMPFKDPSPCSNN